MDALLYALKYAGSKQLILRRTYRELERSLIRTALTVYPRGLYAYNASNHIMTFKNQSIVDFGFCHNENDVYIYQSAEYDVIRFDELTHFTEQMYLYLLSRCRGANDYPKHIKSSTNPGGVGHSWVKSRFIDIAPPNTLIKTVAGTRIFIPATVQENRFLMDTDPDYIKRLENLSERDKQALLYGDWDIFEGQYFTEWNRDIHVTQPIELPDYWRRYFAMDYGLDMLAGYWIAVDEQGRAYVYREIYQPNLIISDAAMRINAMTTERIDAYFAPPDLWNRRQETGQSVAELFAQHHIPLVKANNDRVQGWYALREWLKPCTDEFGKQSANLKIFSNCTNLIRTLPALQIDERNPNDVAREPHELTHAPDALRYFIAGRPLPTTMPKQRDYDDAPEYDYQVDDFLSYGV